MAINATKEKREQIPAGTYVARCYSMIDIGTVPYEWQGEMKKSHKVRITFELPTELKIFKPEDGEKPLVISREFTLSLSDNSKLLPFLEGWRGKKFTEEEKGAFDITKLVGVPAMVSIIHNDKGYADIASASKLPKGMECPPQVNKNQVLEYDNWNEELYQKLPKFIQDKIQKSDEYHKMQGTQETPPDSVDSINPDEVPF